MSATKYCFVDIDGVLRHKTFFKEHRDELTNDHLDGMYLFDPVSMGNLNRIVEETGCEIVVSSSWRLSMEPSDLVNVFRFNDFKGTIAGITPIYLGSYDHSVPRGKEIDGWLSQHKCESYCIIDDCNNMLKHQNPNLVIVDDNIGLTESDADMAIHILTATC